MTTGFLPKYLLIAQEDNPDALWADYYILMWMRDGVENNRKYEAARRDGDGGGWVIK